MAPVDFIPPALAAVVLLGGIARGIVLYRRKPSPFAQAVANSLECAPEDWDYQSGSSYWLENDEAKLAIYMSCGEVSEIQTTVYVNRGLRTIQHLTGKDKSVIGHAFGHWKKATAPEREQTAEQRKREAMRVLVRRSLKAA